MMIQNFVKLIITPQLKWKQMWINSLKSQTMIIHHKDINWLKLSANTNIKDDFQQIHDMTLTRNTIVACTKITRQETNITRLQIAEAVIISCCIQQHMLEWRYSAYLHKYSHMPYMYTYFFFNSIYFNIELKKIYIFEN